MILLIGVSFIMKLFKKMKWVIVFLAALTLTIYCIVFINIDMTNKNKYLEETKNTTESLIDDNGYSKLFLRDEDKSFMKIYYDKNPFNLKIAFKNYNIIFKEGMAKEAKENFQVNMDSLKEYVKNIFLK